MILVLALLPLLSSGLPADNSPTEDADTNLTPPALFLQPAHHNFNNGVPWIVPSPTGSIQSINFKAKREVSEQSMFRWIYSTTTELMNQLMEEDLLFEPKIHAKVQYYHRVPDTKVSAYNDWYREVIPGDIVAFNANVSAHIAKETTKPIVVYVHGFVKDENAIAEFGINYLRARDVHLVCINWLAGLNTMSVDTRKRRVLQVGEYLEYLIYLIIKQDKHTGRDIVCIGHGLGAHICGIAGERLRNPPKQLFYNPMRRSYQLGVIIGLDPDKNVHESFPIEHRIDLTDAKMVIVIHSATGYYGVEEAIGSFDVYVNGGSEQPGCNKYRLPYNYGKTNSQNNLNQMIRMQRQICTNKYLCANVRANVFLFGQICVCMRKLWIQ